MMFYSKATFLTLWFLLFPDFAFAYLDPGSGSMLLYFIIGVFATLIYSIRNLFFTLKGHIYRFFSKDKVNLTDAKNIVFYSEGGHYWHTFKPIIERLSAMGIACSYYTSDKNDPGLKLQYQHVDSLFIGDGRFSLMSLNYLNAKVLIMTTPQLGVMHLKRSKTVDYFVHLVHAPTDVLNYKPFAFDFFDCVMCSGQHQIDHLRLIERTRNMPAKKLLKTGLVYFDELLKNKTQNQHKNQQKTVLVAPTWGQHSLLNKVGFKSLALLTKAGFKVIFRPHSQSYVNDITLIEEIKSQCDKDSLITIDEAPDGQHAMEQADIMVSDISGIIFDFAFVYEKPVIAFSHILAQDRLAEITELNATEKTQATIWEVEKIAEIATEIDIKQVDNLPDLVMQALKVDTTDNIKRLREDALFNYGVAGKIAANQIKGLAAVLDN